MKIKLLLCGVLMALPAQAAWELTRIMPALGSANAVQAAAIEPQATVEQGPLRIPVELVSKGGTREWVMVEVEPQAIPEPSAAILLLLAGLGLCLRRERAR